MDIFCDYIILTVNIFIYFFETSSLWNVEPAVMVKAAENSMHFLDWYLSALAQMTDSLEVNDKGSGSDISEACQVQSWRYVKCSVNEIIDLASFSFHWFLS